MNKKEAQAQIKKLSKSLEDHNYNYYVLDQPVISDKEYDDFLKELIDLEAAFPELIDANSPSQRIGTKIASGAKTIKHRVKMYSLDNSYNIEELEKWHQRVLKGLGSRHGEYVAEYKIDGVSMSLTYQDGELTQAATRGDGIEGEDVLHGVRTIRSLPLKLNQTKSNPFPKLMEVRGEVFMNRSEFDKLNKRRKKNNKTLFANPRNATSGSIKLLDSRITAQRNLKITIHSFGVLEGQHSIKSQNDFLRRCKQWGFPINQETRLCSSFKDVISYCEKAAEKRDLLDYEVDGAVIKVNDLAQQIELGATLKSPRWAIAYKFAAYQATTKIEEISVQVGRTGVLTPVANLKSVSCGGVTISRATLHNFDEIKRLNVRVGDKVLIERAGDVIPKIVKVVESSQKKERVITPPSKCPECNGPIIKEDADLVAYRCENPSCRKQLERRLLHFASRQAMDIEGLGEQVVKQLIEADKVHDLADIYYLKKDDLLALDLFADKKADNLIQAIKESKKQSLARFIFGIGIMHVGEKVASVLAGMYGSLDKFKNAQELDLQQIPEVGAVIAQSVVSTFHLTSTKNLLLKFDKIGMKLIEPKAKLKSSRLLHKRFVFTGELSDLSRTQAGKMIKSYGADVVKSVSNQTDYVVVGKSPGSKLNKAKSLGVTILNEEQFKEMINA